MNGDVLSCSSTVEKIEKLLDSELYILTNRLNPQKISISHLGRLTVPSEVSLTNYIM